MFRNLIPAVANRYRLLAPEYPGFGHNSMPPRDELAYTFDNLAGVVKEFPVMLEKRHSVRVSLFNKDDGDHAGEPAGQGSKMSRGASDDDFDARYCP